MLDCQHYLCQVELCFVLLEVDLIIQHFAQISSRQVLQHKNMAFFLTEREWGLHKMVSCYFLENLVLVFDSFEFFDVVLVVYSHYL